MKICSKCGAKQQDHRTFCVDCGERLGDPLSAAEETKARAEMDATVERLYNQKDPLYVSKWDRLGGLLSLLFCIVLLVISLFVGRWDDAAYVVLLAVLMTAVCMLEAFFPKLTWALEKMRLSFYVHGADDLIPSDFYFITRKIFIWGTAVFNFVLLVVAVISLFKGASPEQPNIIIY